MEVRVHKFDHKGWPMYLTVMSGKRIAEISDVDSVDKDPDAYQREPIKARFADIKNFIENTEGLIPGAILLNVRPDKLDSVQSSYSKLGEQGGIEFGIVNLPDEKFAWVMDGQHRVGAFERLDGDVLVPVVLTLGLSRPKEGETFNVVNSNQKNVPASLNFYDLFRYSEEGVKEWTRKAKKESEQLAYNIVVAINKDSLWQGRINLTGVRGMKRAINLKGFMDALDPVVKDRTFATLPQDKQIELVRTFWQAVNKVWPIALSPDSASVLNKTFGVTVACGIAIDIFLYCRELNDSSEDKMAELLDSVKPLVGDWSPYGPLRSYMGGGRKNVAFVIGTLRDRLRNRMEEIRQEQSVKAA